MDTGFNCPYKKLYLRLSANVIPFGQVVILLLIFQSSTEDWRNLVLLARSFFYCQVLNIQVRYLDVGTDRP